MAGRKGIRGLYKRGRIWWMVYSVEKHTIRESTGKTKRDDAEAILNATKHAIRTGHYVPEEQREQRLPHPWEIVCKSYLEDRTTKGKRLDSYRKLADWKVAFTGRDVRAVTLDDVERQLAAWKEARGWSPATYNNALACVSGVFSFAYRKGYIERHPMKGRAERMQTSNGRERYFYPHEITAMRRTAEALARLKKQPKRWLADIIIAAAFTGLRRGVLCAARCRDVRKDEAGDLWLRVDRDKNGEPIEKRLVGEVREVVERRLDRKVPGAFLFPGPDQGNAYTSIGRYLPGVADRVGREHPDWGLRWGIKGGVTFHSFRHAMASLALNSGTPLDVVQKMGNWKTATMVRRYAHRADRHVREAEDRLANVLSLHTSAQSPEGAISRTA